jgi:LysM repeat protein
MHILKRYILLLGFVCSALLSWGQMKYNSRYQLYFDQYKDLAIEQMLRYRIPASITLAQGVFESGAGLSTLATIGNNHFGIKCHGWSGRSMTKDDDEQNECFRAYDNVRQSYEDHSVFLARNQRYARLFALDATDYRGWARGLRECGYATNPQYAQKLIDIIELYQLYRYDTATGYDKFMAQRASVDHPVERGATLHPIKIFNKNYYLIARRGDTFKSIGKETELSWRKLAKYNERDKHDVLQEGDIIYLKKKQKRAPKTYKHQPHVVQPGESMYSIAQRYGIRLKNLYKMNNLDPTYQIRVGQQLRVY